MSRTSSRKRHSLVALAVVVVLLPGAAAHAQVDDDTRPFTPFRVTIVDDGILNATMPFDVKFIIWGDVAADKTEVTLEIRTVTGDLNCKPGEGTRKQITTVKPRKWVARDYVTHGIMDPTEELTTKDNQFEVLVNELSPRAFYCLTFSAGRPLTPAEGAQLVSALRPAFQGFLSSLTATQLNAPHQQQLEPMRQALIAALMAASPLRIAPRAGTMFDKDIKTAKVSAEFNNNTLEVFAEHGRVRDRLSNFNNGINDRAKALANLGQQAATALNTASLDAALRTRLAESALLTTELISRRLNGLPPTAPGVTPLADSWDADPAVLAPPLGAAVVGAACPTRGAYVDHCKALTDYRAELQKDRDAAAMSAATNAKELTQAFDESLAALDNQKIQLLGAQNAINNRFAAMNAVLQLLDAKLITESFSQLATTEGSATTRRTWYVSADTGIAVAPSLNEVFPYAGTTMFFRPVNKAVPPSSFGTRFSVLFGFTWTANLQKTNERKALFGENATVLLGAGLRLTEWLRITGGGVVFKAVNPNPLLDKTQLKITPFVSMSADIDAADVLKSIFGAQAKAPESGRVLSEEGK